MRKMLRLPRRKNQRNKAPICFERWLLAGVLMLSTGLQANIVGSDHQNFNPANGDSDYITVFSPRTQGQGKLNLGLSVNLGVNTLPYLDENFEPERDFDSTYNDSITAMDVLIAIGLFDWWDFGISMPYIVHQQIEENDEGYGRFSKLGNTEIRLNSKFRLLDTGPFALALIGTGNLNRVTNNPYTGDETWPAYSAELLAELDIGLLRIAGNLGHRWRNSGEAVAFDDDVAIEPFENQWIFSAAVAIPLFGSGMEAIAETYGSYTEKDITLISARNASVLEGVIALKGRFLDQFAWNVGFGREMRHAISSADQRYFAGINWAFDVIPERPIVEEAQVLSTEEPVAAIAPMRQPDEVIIIDDVLFEFDSDVLREDNIGIQSLERLSQVLGRQEAIEAVVVAGHACAIGSEVYNLDLSERRAEEILDWLVSRFEVRREKIIPVGFGEQDPAMSNTDESGRRRNRRVTFEIYYHNDLLP